MAEKELEDQQPSRMRAISTIAIISTLVLLGMFVWYLWLKSWQPIEQHPIGAGDWLGYLLNEKIADVGQLISGIAGAIAFIWLVAAFLQQGSQLAMQREELKLTRRELALQRQETGRLADEAHAQARLLERSGATARAEAFSRMLEMYESRLAIQAAEICRLAISDVASSKDYEAAWLAYQRGDRDALIRNLSQHVVLGRHVDFLKRIDQYASGRGYLRKFCDTARLARDEAAKVDSQMEAFCASSSWAFLAECLEKMLVEQ